MEALKYIISWTHIISASASLITGAIILLTLKGTPRHQKTGSWYFYLMLVNNITALFIYNTVGFFFPHWLAIAVLLIIIPGFVITKYKNFNGWLALHIICFVVSYYLLIGGAINEAFIRIEPLIQLMKTQPLVFGLSHVISQVLFIGLLIYYLINRKAMMKKGANLKLVKTSSLTGA